MTTHEKITQAHLDRRAIVYVRQSTLDQVANCRESQELQYALVGRAKLLGWGENRGFI
jgi:hypothetical protein